MAGGGTATSPIAGRSRRVGTGQDPDIYRVGAGPGSGHPGDVEATGCDRVVPGRLESGLRRPSPRWRASIWSVGAIRWRIGPAGSRRVILPEGESASDPFDFNAQPSDGGS